jgi:hypothetical protein
MRALPLKITTALALTVGGTLAASMAGGAGAVEVSHAATYQYGINTYVTYACQTYSQITDMANTEMKAFKALRANSVAIAFPLYTDSLTSNNIYAKYVCGKSNFRSPSAPVLSLVVNAAHKEGLKVLLRPLLDQTNLFQQGPLAWRGKLAPTNLSTWFKNYLTTLRPYLIMAQAHHVEHFAITTELDSLAHVPNWSAAIALSHAIYKGDLAFDYSWGTNTAKTAHSSASTAVDTYPELSGTTPNSTQHQLLVKWDYLLTTKYYSLPNISTVTIDEIGIAAQNGSYGQPFKYSEPLSTYPFNQKIQANWFSTACTFMKSHHMKGIYFWGPFLAQNHGSLLKKPTPSQAGNLQPLAQQAIKSCF